MVCGSSFLVDFLAKTEHTYSVFPSATALAPRRHQWRWVAGVIATFLGPSRYEYSHFYCTVVKAGKA